MNKNFLKLLPLFLLFPLIMPLPRPSSAADEGIKFFISDEVSPCITSGGNPKNCDQNNQTDLLVLNTTHNLRNDWVKYNLDRCSTIPIRGNYVEDNKVEYIFPSGDKIYSTTKLMDLNIDDIINTDSIGIPASTQGTLNTNITSSMQDYSPKPISWLDLPYWTENSGSSLAGSRNALLFEFYDAEMNPIGINSFGAWFGDLETRSDSITGFMRAYDSTQIALTENIVISETNGTDLNQCGNTTGIGKGCGNHTTRWLGFSELSEARIQKLLITVGEDDLGADGSREHLSFTGPTIAIASTCITPTVNIIPSPSTTPTPTSIPTIFPSVTLEPTPTNTIIPTPTHTTTPLPTVIITNTVAPTETISPTTTLTPSLVSPTITPSPIPVNLKPKFCNNDYEWNKKIKFPIIQKLAQLLVNKICTK